MPVLNDELLGNLFTQAGDAFEVPPSGADDIAARALGGDDRTAEPGRPDEAGLLPEAGDRPQARPRPSEAFRTHRLLAVAAGLIVLAGIAGVGLALRHGSPGTGRPTSVAAGPLLPTTTVPGVPHKATEFAPSTAAPSAAPSTSSGSAPGTLQSPGVSAPATTVPPVAPVAPGAGQSTKILQTGSLDLKVRKGALSSTITALTTLATKAQGFVTNTQSQAKVPARGAAPEGSVTLQIPEASFGAVVHQAQALGQSLKLTTKATDVTGRYVDLQSRITALQASRQQYLTILAKATSISDILAVQAQLDNLQSQLEQLQGQLAVLTSHTTYSTLTVTVHEPAPAHRRPAPAPSGIDRAWHDSVHGFFAGVDGVVGAAGPTLFVLLSVGLVVLIGRLLWRRWQRHNL